MISRLHVSLTAAGVNSLTLTQWALTLITVGCFTISACIWWYSQELDQQTAHLQQQINELEQVNQGLVRKATAQGFDLSDTRIQQLPREVTFAKKIWKQQAFSWTQFLNDLEDTVPTKISMDSVTLNFKDSSIGLSGSAATLNDLKNFVDKLETHQAFYHVVLSQHSFKKKQKDKKTKFVKFTMTVSYEPLQT